METTTVIQNQRPTNFRLYLQQELLERCRKNPHYSLRAFAKALKIGPSALSDMLNGKRSITAAMKKRLGLALGLNPSKIQELDNQKQTTNFQQLTLDTFAVISDWYHYGILELMKTQSFKTDPAWISRRLGITKQEANIAIERLSRLSLIEIGENGKWLDTSGGFSTNIDGQLTSAGSKQLQKQILEMSIKALEELNTDVRNHTSMTMAINPKDLPEAMARIKNFRRELCTFLENSNDLKEVYHLALSLYPITKKIDGEKS